jgi:SecD/SecF fusion protein
MPDRRRNYLILLLVAVLVAASAVVIVTKPTKLGLDLQGGVQLIYQVSPTRGEELTDDSIQRTIDVMQDRINQYGVGEAEIQRSGADQIDVSLPSIDNPDEARNRVGTTAQLAFYDWETNVVGPDGEPVPTDPSVTGGTTAASARSTAAITQYDAVMRGSKLEPNVDERFPPLVGDQYYLVDNKTKKVLGGPFNTVESLEQDKRMARYLGPDGEPRSDTVEVVKVPEGYRVLRAEQEINSDGEAIPVGDKYFLIRDRPALRGEDIKNPAASVDTSGPRRDPVVVFEFSDNGKKVWKGVTGDIAQRGADNCIFQQGETQQMRMSRCANHFAIALDNELISSPYIDFEAYPEGISGNTGSQIGGAGSFTQKSAQALADLLKSGSLPLELSIISQQQVSATLGQEALDQGLIAGIAGFVVVALFLIAFYRALGLIAVVGLLAYTVFFLAIVKIIPIVMTLPGIAGLILTIAVAADANIVIFERIKDELQAGRSVQRSIKDGYRKGLSAIIDGNVITFLVAFVLFMVATAGVKGFAFNLGIGVILSMFTAVLMTRAILGLVSRSRLITHPALLGARKRNPIWHRFDFMGYARWFFAASGVVLALGAVAIGAKGINFSIDFESGTQIKLTAKAGTDVEGVRDALRPVDLADAKIQEVKLPGQTGASFQVSTEALSTQQERRVAQQLQTELGVNPADLNTNTVGPTFGKTVANSAVIAIIVSFLLIAFVIWFRFGLRFMTPILIAVIHDLLITAGIYAATGAEVSASTVAALLTIIGYSLYDTIIVFDRVRENMKRLPSAAISQIVNRAMSEVLGRSLVTSFSTGLPVLALLLFGGDTLKDFALAMLIGTISGAYSSVFIAAPVLTAALERAPQFRGRRKRIEAANGGVVPPYPDSSTADEVDPDARPKRKSARVTAADAAGAQVSKDEFREMVQELGIEPSSDSSATGSGIATGQGAPRPQRPTKQTRKQLEEEAAAAEAAQQAASAEPAGPVERAPDLSPEEVGFRDETNGGRTSSRRPGKKRR